VELDSAGDAKPAGYAPYLDYRPLTSEEQEVRSKLEEPDWMKMEFESKVLNYAVSNLVHDHFDEVKQSKIEIIDKTIKAVRDRLTKEIGYWDYRANSLKEQELAGKVNAKLNSGIARSRAENLTTRLNLRMQELEEERNLSPLPPVIVGGALVIPGGLLAKLMGDAPQSGLFARETKRIELLAMESVMATERSLGFTPKDVSSTKCHYDIESTVKDEGRLRFIEVKGRIIGATTITVTKTEILTALNKPEDFILAFVEVDGEKTKVRYIRKPFQKEPDFGAASVNYYLKDILVFAEEPR
jgi:hypothetical protein